MKKEYEMIASLTGNYLIQYHMASNTCSMSANLAALLQLPDEAPIEDVWHAISLKLKEDSLASIKSHIHMCTVDKPTFLCTNMYAQKKENTCYNIMGQAFYTEDGSMKEMLFVAQDVMSNIQQMKDLWNAAYTDPLTGLFNRNGIENKITHSMENMSPTAEVALLIADADNFKHVNDTYGHMFGDAVLIEISDMLRECFSENAVIGRIGGDEFLVYQMGVTDRDVICKKAQQLCKMAEEHFNEKHLAHGVSLSIGLAFTSDTRVQYNNLFREVDLALYNAKAHGKNCYEMYYEGMKKAIPTNDRKNAAAGQQQIGLSGFSLSKLLLDDVIEVLDEVEDPKTAIEKVSKLIVEAFDVTRAYASCNSKDGTHVTASYFYAQDDEPNIPPNIKMNTAEHLKRFNQDGIFFCTDIDTVQEPMHTQLVRMKVETMLQIIIYNKEGKYIGILGVNNCNYKRLWIQNEIETLHTIAKLLTNHIIRLQDMSE